MTFRLWRCLNPSYCCPKSGQISRIFLAKLRCQKKKTRLQFSISSLHMNRTWVSHGTFQVLFISEVKTQNCSRVFFFWHRIILMTNSKFQTPLTLNSHKSGLKNHRIKNYHISEPPGRYFSFCGQIEIKYFYLAR